MPIDSHLDVLALIRSRLTGSDEDFLLLIQDKTNAEIIGLLNHMATYSALTIQEFIDKIGRMCETLGVQAQDESAISYLDSVVKEVIAQQSDVVD